MADQAPYTPTEACAYCAGIAEWTAEKGRPFVQFMSSVFENVPKNFKH